MSTYPSMMGLINELKDGQRRFGVGHFDLIVIDEAHRSVYQKYRAIFDYFDSLLVGLTATPKDEIDINTYSLFDLERGVPTDAYPLEDAIKDRFLVPPFSRTVPIKFPRQGIAYDDLSEEEKELWDATEWDDDGTTPTRVESSALNTLAVQRGHRRQGARPPDDARPACGRRRPARQDDHLCEEPGPRRVHHQAFRRQLSPPQGHVRARHLSQRALRAEPDRRLLEPGEATPHRRLRRHARHRYRYTRDRQPGVPQAGALEDEVLADGGPRNPPVSRPLRAGPGQDRL